MPWGILIIFDKSHPCVVASEAFAIPTLAQSTNASVDIMLDTGRFSSVDNLPATHTKSSKRVIRNSSMADFTLPCGRHRSFLLPPRTLSLNALKHEISEV